MGRPYGWRSPRDAYALGDNSMILREFPRELPVDDYDPWTDDETKPERNEDERTS